MPILLPTLQTLKPAVIGLGYVGIPIALSIAKSLGNAIGFDIDEKKVRQLQSGSDSTGSADADELAKSELVITHERKDLNGCNFFVVCVPTPLEKFNKPDLSFLLGACEIIGPVLRAGSVVVFESTVYPGVTEDVCGPALEESSGLVQGEGFFLGYSPERINPGDSRHQLGTIKKVISAQNQEVLALLEKVYSRFVVAGVYSAASIQVAEAAKVLENTQRDLNVALINELAVICHSLGLDTQDVLEAAGTKWNFHQFSPGLVGGHCIGIDPYYLAAKAEEIGVIPQVILAGRRVNNSMGKFVAQGVIKSLIAKGRQVLGARAGLLGLAFKEGVGDIRNSGVKEVVDELRLFGIEILAHDPLVDSEEARKFMGVDPLPAESLTNLDCVILAVPHPGFPEEAKNLLSNPKGRRSPCALIDVKAVIRPDEIPPDVALWRL